MPAGPSGEKIETKPDVEATQIPTKPVNPLDIPLPAEDESSDGNAQSPGEQRIGILSKRKRLIRLRSRINSF